jgi:hypothetical protein
MASYTINANEALATGLMGTSDNGATAVQMNALATSIFAVGYAVGLYTNNPTLTRSTAYGDLTEAAFNGYGRKTPVFAASSIADPGTAGRVVVSSNSMIITNSDAGAVTITGIFWVKGAGRLIWANPLAVPLTLQPSDSVSLEITMYLYNG